MLCRPSSFLSLLLASVAAAQGQRASAPDGLTAFRPQHGAGYFPFVRTAVPDAPEEDPLLGPGIRVNGAGEIDLAGEDDLIEISVRPVLAGVSLVLERNGPGLELWTTRDKQAGTQLPFSGDRTATLTSGGAPALTLWVECTAPGSARLPLVLRAQERDTALDRLLFHRFESIVLALGGEGQVPVQPPDPNFGTFDVAIALYEQGHDAFQYDEDGVSATGDGPVFDETVNAIMHRAVDQVAIFGYSHGGGSTHDLANRLDTFHMGIGDFSVPFTSYVDGVRNSSDIDTAMELRFPPASLYHANQYQRGSFADFFLDGGPVPGSDPPPGGLDVETTVFGAGATHFIVDDFAQVRDFIRSNLDLRASR